MGAARFPAGIALEYEASLRKYAREAGRIVLAQVFPILDREGDGVVSGVPLQVLGRALDKCRSELVQLTSRAPGLATGMLVRLEKSNRQAMNEQWTRAVDLAPFTAPPVVRSARMDAKGPTVTEAMQTRLAENVRLITSIPGELLSQVEQVLREDFPKGLRVEVIQSHLEERFSVAESRARLIARDQVGKLNAGLTEARNRSLGVTRYTWQTSGDERVRGNPDGLWPKGLHYELNGQVFSYSDPPITNEDGDRNNPGEDYQCRCNAVPVLEDALEALGI